LTPDFDEWYAVRSRLETLLLMTQDLPTFDSTQTQEFLEGLARIHPFVLVASADGTIEWMNERLRERFDGTSVPAFVAKREQLGALQDGLRTPTFSSSVRLDAETEDGTQICFDADAVAMTGGTLDAPDYVVIARPQEEFVENARALEGTVSLLSQILESSPDGVVATDGSGYITYANPQAANFLGLESRDLMGRPAALFLAQVLGAAELFEKLRTPASWKDEEVELVVADQNLKLSVSMKPLRDDAGREVGIVTYLQNVSEQALVKEALERKNCELESYVDSVAHDLRSPLVSLLGFSRLLREDYENRLDKKAHRFLDRIEEAGHTMDALIHDLLELSRIREPEEHPPALDPGSILQQLAAELKLRLEEQGIELLLPAEPPMMQIDGTRLYQVFSNLVGNALKHGFAATEPCTNPRISIEIREVKSGHEIVVSDNGCGLPEEDHERVFQVFRTGRGVRRGERSHGMGLAIVKKIAEAHGGRAWLASEPGRGARFHVLFPVSKPLRALSKGR
jgi:PAS domain S-box-containing protein